MSMKKSTKIEEEASLVFDFDDIKNEEEQTSEKIVSDNSVDESVAIDEKTDTAKNYKSEANNNATETKSNPISSLISKNLSIKDYSMKWDFIIKNGIEKLIEKNKSK